MPPLYPPSLTAPLNTAKGYTINPVTGDSIQPIINFFGDTVKTGVPVAARGKIIESAGVPPPRVVEAGRPNITQAHQNVHRIPDTLTRIPLDKEHLLTFNPWGGASSFVRVNSRGDTLSTGVPVRTQLKAVPLLQPRPVAALPQTMRDHATVSIKYLDSGHGMNSSQVASILEDRRGNLWFGTQGGGASMYNGESFTHFTEKEGLSSNLVNDILEDRRGNLWFSTGGGGVSMYDGEEFRHFTEREGLSSNNVGNMLEDSKGSLWFCTFPNGVARYDGETFTRITNKEGLINFVTSIEEDRLGNIWFGIWNGECMYDGQGFTYFLWENYDVGYVVTILEDSSGQLWFGSLGGPGLSMYDGNTFTYFTKKQGLSYDSISDILEDNKGNLWIGTDGGGVNTFDGETFVHITKEEGLSYNSVGSILEDGYGNFWFGTYGGGVNIYNPSGFKYLTEYEGLSNNNILSIQEDGNGNLWFGSDRGVIKYDGETFTNYTEKEGLISNTVKSILEDSRGNLWFGSVCCGIDMYNGSTFTHFYETEAMGLATCTSFLEDRGGNLWFCSFEGGISKYDGSSFTHYLEKEGLSNRSIIDALEDREGNLWFATVSGGVSRYNGETFMHITEKEGLSRNHVTSILEDNRGYLWFGTWGGGVSVFDGESFTYITEREGLSDNYISTMLEDSTGNVWVLSLKGLNLLVLGTGTNSVTDEKSAKPPFFHSLIRTYGEQDGWRNLEYGNSFLDSKNRIWWGGREGLALLEMKDFKLPVDPPSMMQLNRVEINEKFLDFRHLPEDGDMKIKFDSVPRFYNYPVNLKLPHKNNHLTFYFSAIDWAAPNRLKYSYKMRGSKENWSVPTAETKAEYRNLPQGTHTFEVRAIGAAQKWSEPFEYTFTVHPPWWFSWWAYVIYGLMLLAIIDQYRRYLLRRAKLKSAVEIERFEKEKVLEMDQMKSRFFANISHEFRTPLTLILGPVEGLMKKKGNDIPMKRDDLGMIHRNAKRLQLLINQILDISKLETGNIRLRVSAGDVTEFVRRIVLSFLSLAESKSIVYEYDLPEAPGPLYYDADKLEKILTNLISNAFKFTPPGGKIKIILDYRHHTETVAVQYAKISIEDSGIGIAAEQVEKIFDRFYQVGSSDTREHEGTGIGLSLTRELVGIYRGELQVASQPGKGSVFTVTVPVSGNLFEPEEMADSNPIIPEGASSADDAIAAGSVVENEALPEKDNLNESGRPVILIVEDNTDLRRFISGNLNEEYHIVEAGNGREGLTRAIEEIPDLIITDLMMPEMDGIELCEKIRMDRATSHIPIVMLTARADKESKLKGLKTGADDYLIKPFDADELLVRVLNLIRQRSILKKKYQEEFIQTDPFTKEIPDLKDDFIAAVIKCILTHLGEPDYGVDQLARDVGFSRSQLYRKLLSMTGYVPNKFIRNIRLKQSVRMFHEGYKNITQVLYTVGFNSPSHFSQSFREFYGMNPSDYLKQAFGSKE